MEPRRWEEIESAFRELIALDRVAQRERLAALGATDPGLRAAVEKLLAADAEADARLAPIAAALVAPVATSLDPLAASLAGRYRVERELGHGGMAMVYLAHDLKHDRAVALKVLKPELAAALGRERFLREVALTARLDHPHIVPLLDSGDAGGLLYYVMPYVEGESLRDRLDREKQLSLDEALQITREVADALDYAHSHHIVHRDIKPANILLGDGHARVADFGIARAVTAAGGAALTETGIAVGTPAYMSPEQATAEREVDGRSDVYSLACVVYEMLAGQPPYTGATPQAILARKAVEAVPSLRVVRAAVPASVEQALTLGLAKVPADRFATASQLAHALQRGAYEQPPQSPPRIPRRALAIGAAAAILAGATFVVLRSAGRGAGAIGATAGISHTSAEQRGTSPREVPLERSIAVLPFDNLSAQKEDEILVGGLQDAVITQLASIPDLRVIGRQSVRGYAATDKRLRQIGLELGVGRIVQTGVLRVGKRVRVTVQLSDASTDQLVWANQYERTDADLFGLQKDIALAIADALEAKLTSDERERVMRPPTKNSEAYNFYLQGREYQQRSRGVGSVIFAPREEDTKAAESLFRRAVQLDPAFALAHAQLAHVYGYDAQPERMRTEAEAALRLQPDLPEAHLAMGRYWGSGGDDARALVEFEIARRGLPNDAYVLTQLAVVHRKLGRWEEALGELEQAARLDPRESTTLVNLPFTYQAMRRYPEAVRAWGHAIEIFPDNYRYVMERGRLFVRWQGNLDSLAAALHRIPRGYDPEGQITLAWVDLALYRRRPKDALAAFAAMRPEFLEGDHYSNIGSLRYMRARAYEALGDSSKARADFEAARAAVERWVQKSPEDGHAHADLGIVYAWMGRKSEAIREARRGVELLPLSKDAFYAPIVMWHAAETYARLGEQNAAVELLNRLLTIPNFLVSSVRELRLDPRWDSLRGDPSFQRLLGQGGSDTIRSSRRDTAALSRVIVMPFENRTGDASLDPVGAITADWVAQGLNEPGFLTVLDTHSALAAAARLGAGASPVAVGRETGAGVVVAGSYFLLDDSLQFQARIVSAADDRILTSIGRIVAPRARPQAGVEQVRQHVLAALASLHDKDVASFQTNLPQPPTYDAYREYTEGLAYYMRFDYQAAAQHFERAAALDSTFLTARLWAAQTSLWLDVASSRRVESILVELKPLRDRLSPFDRARFDYIAALRQVVALGGRNLLESDDQADPLQAAYRAALRMVDAAPGSVDARREAALSALRVSRPRKALRVLNALDPERGLMRDWFLYWMAVAWAHHQLGEYDQELVAARRGRNAGPLLFPELRALAALGRVQELDSLAHAEFRAEPQWAGVAAYDLAGELSAHGHPELARRLARDVAQLLAAHPPADSAGARDEWLRERAWLALFLGDAPTAAECVAQFRYPEEQRFLLAHLLAAQGRRQEALAELEAAKRWVTHNGGALDRQVALEAAGVLVRLNDLDGALAVLAQTTTTDPIMLGTKGRDGHAEPELAPLWNDPRFRALIKPRG